MRARARRHRRPRAFGAVFVTADSGAGPLVGAPAPRDRPWRRPLVRFVVRRLAAGVVTLFAASILIFASVQVLPGNVAAIVLGQHATPARVAALEANLKLNEPIPQR